VGSSERGRNENPVEERTSRTASVGRAISRKILAAETGWSRTEWTPEFLAIEFKRKQDVRSNYMEKATEAAQEQYKSLLTGLQAVGLVKGWKVQQVVFVGGTCGSVHAELLHRNMKTLVVLKSKWDPIR
jgi:hypothetical protein